MDLIGPDEEVLKKGGNLENLELPGRRKLLLVLVGGDAGGGLVNYFVLAVHDVGFDNMDEAI